MYNAISLKNMRRIISPPPFEIILPLNFDDFFSFLNWREKKVFGFFFLEYWCLQFTIFGLLWIYYVIKPIDRVIHFFFLLSSTPCRKWSTTSTHHPVNRKIEINRLNVINLYLTHDSKLSEVKKLQPKKKEAFKDS